MAVEDLLKKGLDELHSEWVHFQVIGRGYTEMDYKRLAVLAQATALIEKAVEILSDKTWE